MTAQVPETGKDPSPEQDSPSPGPRSLSNGAAIYWSLAGLVLLALLTWVFWDTTKSFSLEWWELAQDKDAFRARIQSYGPWAPVVFILLQISQVLVSPIPGELVGAVGGYAFGWLGAVLYSTIGLSLGSWINFFAARLLGRALVERLIPSKYLEKLSFIMERQGVIASFMFFIFPGFPKDYLSYALGISPMNWRVFLVISSVGRIPGTLMLSLQGSLVYQEQYWSFAVLLLLSLGFMAPAYIWRENIYLWLKCLEGKRESQPPDSP